MIIKRFIKRIKKQFLAKSSKESSMWQYLRQIKAMNEPFTLARIQDDQLQKDFSRSFNELYARLFTLTDAQRKTRFHILDLIYDMRYQINESVKDFIDRSSQSSTEEAIKHAKAYIKLNTIRSQFVVAKSIYNVKLFAMKMKQKRA